MTVIYKTVMGWPMPGESSDGTNVTTQLCDGQNEAVWAVFTMPADDTITHVGFVNASKAGTPADDTWTVSIQGVTTGGVPDGTILGVGTPASRTFPNATYTAASFGTNTYHMIQLDNSIALESGTQYALVVQKTGATDATNTLTFRVGLNASGRHSVYPYCGTADTTPTYTKNSSIPFGWSIRSASKTYLYPIITSANQAIGTTTEKGFSFTVDSGFGASNTYALRGVRLAIGITAFAAGQTYVCNLYSGTGGSNPTILQTTGELDSDILGAATGGRGLEVIFPEDSLTALTPGTKYGIGFSCTNATAGSVNTFTLADADARTALPQPAMTYMTRTLASAYPPDASDGAFTETTSTIVVAELIIGEFTASAGGGGGIKLAGRGGLAG